MRKHTVIGLALIASLVVLCQNCQPNPHQEGERLYKTNCANCHMDNGAGLAALIPPLAGSDYLTANRDKLPCIIRKGLTDTIQVNGVTYREQMLPISALSDIQITNVLNYVMSQWGQGEPYRLDEVRQILEQCR